MCLVHVNLKLVLLSNQLWLVWKCLVFSAQLRGHQAFITASDLHEFDADEIVCCLLPLTLVTRMHAHKGPWRNETHVRIQCRLSICVLRLSSCGDAIGCSRPEFQRYFFQRRKRQTRWTFSCPDRTENGFSTSWLNVFLCRDRILGRGWPPKNVLPFQFEHAPFESICSLPIGTRRVQSFQSWIPRSDF